MKLSRRMFIRRLLQTGLLAGSAPVLIREVLAMGDRHYTQGMNKVSGTVLLNNEPAKVGGLVQAGDSISTGADSMAIFVLDRDAYLLRGNSRLELKGEQGVVQSLSLLAGKMLSVFGKGDKKILLPTATLGIRGTALYAEAEATRCYVCTCYGTVHIQSRMQPQSTETVVSKHHDAPRYIYASGEVMIAKASAINHTDDELFMLEALVGRMPAFYSPAYNQGTNSY